MSGDASASRRGGYTTRVHSARRLNIERLTFRHHCYGQVRVDPMSIGHFEPLSRRGWLATAPMSWQDVERRSKVRKEAIDGQRTRNLTDLSSSRVLWFCVQNQRADSSRD